MLHEGFTGQHRTIGRIASFAASSLLLTYGITLVFGFLSLRSPSDPIGDPYFSILELLIIVTAPLMVIVMVAVHAYASPDTKIYSLASLAFMTIMAGITCSVHFVILTVSRQVEAAGFPWGSLFFSFRWLSVVYTLDILAWDFFFALSMLFAAPVFKIGRLEKIVRILMILSGVLSLAGLIGVPLANMNLRNIGILGYAGVSIVLFLVLGIVFGRARQAAEEIR
ncbi:hypothetical protein EQO05_05525 [Methanosarcina sp. MSH10X1]|uniref:hypothetical protein n=1 Tax=Methanosarcina sp. MSH10X1 TaxID=2507075 RepID=UPI000FFC1FCE|nr:hypothetical protein [Methanosarcina sp. MSH10X1]RXA20576.1 hypothetical protein EQO05_05525 [Methanosarcina sp. MSH10X1]